MPWPICSPTFAVPTTATGLPRGKYGIRSPAPWIAGARCPKISDVATSGGSTNVDPNHLEAWKGLIDFAKTVLSLSTAVLAAYVSYVVVNGESLHGWDFISPGLLVASIILSLFGFGRALPALKSGTSSVPGIFMTNASVGALVLAICLIPFTQPMHPSSIDQ